MSAAPSHKALVTLRTVYLPGESTPMSKASQPPRGSMLRCSEQSTFERVILQCLEAGTLQNQLFDDPGRLTHRFMRAFVGAFLRLPPLKRALLSKALRSRFLAALRAGAGSTAEAVS